MSSQGEKNEQKSCSNTTGLIVPDPVWVLGKWEGSANKLSQLPLVNLLQARHGCAPWDQGAQGLAQKIMPGAGKRKGMSGCRAVYSRWHIMNPLKWGSCCHTLGEMLASINQFKLARACSCTYTDLLKEICFCAPRKPCWDGTCCNCAFYTGLVLKRDQAVVYIKKTLIKAQQHI